MIFRQACFFMMFSFVLLHPAGCSLKVSKADPMEEVIMKSLGKYEFHAGDNYRNVYTTILEQSRNCFHDVATRNRVVQGDLQPDMKSGNVIISYVGRSGYEPYFGFKITSTGDDSTKVESYWVNVNDNHIPKIAERWVKEKYNKCL